LSNHTCKTIAGHTDVAYKTSIVNSLI